MSLYWAAPDGGARVTISTPAVQELRGQVLKAFLDENREVGGLLLGWFDQHYPPAVRIEGHEEIPCSYLHGKKNYVLSETDRANLKAALTKRRPEHGPGIVGFYRSYAGRDAVFDSDDEDLLSTYFWNRANVFLLLKPVSATECYAAFRWGEELSSAKPIIMFSFCDSRPVLEPEDESAVAVGAGIASAVMAQSEPNGGMAQVAEPAGIEPPTPEPGSGVTENIRSPVSHAAIELPPAHRRLIEEQTKPEENDVSFWPDDALGPEKEERKPRFWLPWIASIVLSIAAATAYEWWTVGRQTNIASVPAPPPAAKQAPAEPGEHATPESSAPAPSAPANSAGVAARAAPVNQPASEARTVPSSDSQSKPGTAPVAERSRTVTTHLSQAIAVPPEVLHEVQPGISPGIHARITDRIVIPVRVTVSVSGGVISAVAENQDKSNGLYQYLADRAAKAALSWKFSPGRTKDGSRVAAEKTIYFVFTP